MRLTPEQIDAIRTGVPQVAGRDARVWLFGSRVHDQERGGDVDLLLELDVPVSEPAQLAAFRHVFRAPCTAERLTLW